MGKLEIGNFKMSWGGEKRSVTDELHTINGTILNSILYGDGYTDEPVTIRKGLRVGAAYTSVNVISRTISSLPINIIKEENGKKTPQLDHSAYYPLAHEPNSYMSSANFFLTGMVQNCGWGNTYAHISRDSRRNPIAFDLLEPWEVDVTASEGTLWYHYHGETFPGRDILHFRWYSLDGICGKSPILENQDVFGMAIKLKRYASLILGAQPPGVLSYEGNLTPEQRAENKKEWSGGSKGDVKVLSGKWGYTPIITPADETQYNETKKNNEREIYGIYQIPPTFAQNFERATYSNAEQSDLVYAKHTVMPIIRMIEQECNMKLFFEREKLNTYVKFNLNGLLRGDIAARQAFYQSMVNIGGMLRNEVRELEDLNPYEGGDTPLIQGAMIPGDKAGIDALRQKMEKETIPSAPPINGPGPKNYINGHTHAN